MIPFETPPLVGAWTQNFQWSMGIIRISFLQSFCRWYQRATGGKPSTLLSTVTFSSVELYRRSNAEAYTANLKAQSVCGTERVALSSGIETTNLFVSVLVWFFVSVILLSSVMICLKFIYSRFDHRQWHQPLHWCGPLWLSYYKGSLYRLVSQPEDRVPLPCLRAVNTRPELGSSRLEQRWLESRGSSGLFHLLLFVDGKSFDKIPTSSEH